MKDVDELENLASIYGHYVDKSRHDDVADLFAPEGVVEILGRGVFIGQDRVREYMLQPHAGQRRPARRLAVQPHAPAARRARAPDGETAHVRSRLFVMFGIMNTNAQWGDGIYENVFVKQDGVWKLDYLHGYQTFYTNYEDGWAKQGVGDLRAVRPLAAGPAAVGAVRAVPGGVRAAVPLPQSGVGPRRSLQGSDVARRAGAGRAVSTAASAGASRAAAQCRLRKKARWGESLLSSEPSPGWQAPSGQRIGLSVVVALVVAAVVLVIAVLPAEYGIDPTGVGRALGLTELNAPPTRTLEIKDVLGGNETRPRGRDPGVQRAGPAAEPRGASGRGPADPDAHDDDDASRRGQETEVKTVLRANKVIVYTWKTDGGLVYCDMHGHDPAAGSDFFVRYREDQEGATEATGSLVAPFDGEHGWYWLNINDGPVTITLTVTGFFDDIVDYGIHLTENRRAMWEHNYDPLGNPMLSTLVAAVPIVVLLLMIGVLRKPAWMSALAGLGGRHSSSRSSRTACRPISP